MPGKTFYIETFGCQMNAHDSEKVIGTLLAKGYKQVETPEEAELVLYNTCSIRDKAEQKVFNRLQQFKREPARAKCSACWAAWPSRKARRSSSARRTSAWWRLGQLYQAARDAGAAGSRQPPRHRPEPGHRRDLRHAVHPPRQSAPRLHHHHRRLRQILRLLRGAVHARAGAQPHQRKRAWRKRAALAETGYTEIQLLGQNVNSYRDPSPAGWDFATLLARVGEIPGIRRVRFTTSHPRDFVKAIVDAMDANPVLCNHVHLPVQSGSTRVLAAMQRLYTRDEYMRRIDWMKQARRSHAITTDIIVGFPGETEADFEETLDLLDEVEYDSLFSFKYSPRPNTAALAMGDRFPKRRKPRRLVILQEKQRAIQIRRNAALDRRRPKRCWWRAATRRWASGSAAPRTTAR